MPGAEHRPVTADGNHQVKFPGADSFSQAFIVQRAMRSIQTFAFQIFCDGSGLLHGFGQFGVAGDNDSTGDEG